MFGVCVRGRLEGRWGRLSRLCVCVVSYGEEPGGWRCVCVCVWEVVAARALS
eukprot:COSAG03_NODE_297_length_9244_cov_14.706397_9_plen_52_part_00